MANFFKIGVLVFFLFSYAQEGFSQKRNKKGKKNCPTYTEDLRTSLPIYEKPVFDSDTLVKVDSIINLNDDNEKADSLEIALIDYLKDKTRTRGWRIQIWTGQRVKEMNVITERYNEFFEDLDFFVHEDWDRTFFRVKIGDFTDRLEAYKALLKIKEEFPTALLVPDQVDLDKI